MDKRNFDSVLIASPTIKGAQSLTVLLNPYINCEPKSVQSEYDALNLLKNKKFDLVIINAPLLDEVGTKVACSAAKTLGTCILFISEETILERFKPELTDNGVMTVARPLSKSSFDVAIRALSLLHDQMLVMQRKLEESKLVNRAKIILMDRLKMDEPRAHRFIEKEAMDSRSTRVEIARSIINTYDY